MLTTVASGAVALNTAATHPTIAFPPHEETRRLDDTAPMATSVLVRCI